MTLASLPDVLIAHLCTYLDYDDVCNLMETSKKNYNAIKAYKKDKMKADVLRFNDSVYDESHRALTNSKDGPGKIYTCKIFDENSTATPDNVGNVLKECGSVGMIEFSSYDLSSDLTKVLFETKAKIGKVVVKFGTVSLEVEEFVRFCKKFRGSEFISSIILVTNVWNDDILISLIEASTEIRIVDRKAPNTAKLITDRTLKTLFRGNPYTKYFDLDDFHNSFTIKELVNSLKILKESNCKGLKYELGFLQSNQLDDAERYFNMDTAELKDEYYIESRNYGHYNAYLIFVGLSNFRNYKNEEEETPHIYFRVLH